MTPAQKHTHKQAGRQGDAVPGSADHDDGQRGGVQVRRLRVIRLAHGGSGGGVLARLGLQSGQTLAQFLVLELQRSHQMLIGF